MGFTKISAMTLTDVFVQKIEGMILSGELEVGEKLPSVRELSAKMGVSLPVVNAGLTKLEDLGFVEIRPRKGVFVSDYQRTGTMETLMAIMQYNGGVMRGSEIKALIEVRDALECLCIRLVAEKEEDEELKKLEPILEQLQKTEDVEEAAQLCFDFYHELKILSGNPLLPIIFHSFRLQYIYLSTIYCKHYGIRKMYESKRMIYQALLNHDAEEAIRLANEKMESDLESLPKFGARSGRGSKKTEED